MFRILFFIALILLSFSSMSFSKDYTGKTFSLSKPVHIDSMLYCDSINIWKKCMPSILEMENEETLFRLKKAIGKKNTYIISIAW